MDRYARNLSTHLIFIQVEKAYDSVPATSVFKVLRRSERDPHMVVVFSVSIRAVSYTHLDVYKRQV